MKLARYVIPPSATSVNDAILIVLVVVWFSRVPRVILYWCAIKPIELRVGGISPEADPCLLYTLPLKQVFNKSVFPG